MANPVICSKCNMFLGNLYFLNSKINSSAIHRKNKVFYIADDKSQYSYAYCQGCWANYAINNTLIRQKTEPAIEANYSLYLNEHAENVQNKKEIMKKNLIINDLNNNSSDLKIKLSKEHENNNILTNEITLLQDSINILKEESVSANEHIRLLTEKIVILEGNICDKTEENRCSLNCLDLLKNNFFKESKINEHLKEEIIKLNLQLENLNNLDSKYCMTINALEEELIIFRNYINEKENDINSLSNKFEMNKKVMSNESKHNKAEIIKLKQYICDLNDYIENNTVSNELFNNVQSNLENSQKMNHELVDEIESLRHELFGLQMENTKQMENNYIENNNVNDVDAWNVDDDKWIVVDFNNNRIYNNNYDESFVDKTDDDIMEQINEILSDDNNIDYNSNEFESVDFDENNYDNNYNDFVDDENGTFDDNYSNFVEHHINEYCENTNYSDNQYNSFTDNNENTTNCDDTDFVDEYIDNNNDFVDDDNYIDNNENNNNDCYDDFVDDENYTDNNENNDFVDENYTDNNENNDFVDDENYNDNNDFVDDENYDFANDFIDSENDVEQLNVINNNVIIDDLRDSYHIECDVLFDEKIVEKYNDKKQYDQDINFFPIKYTIIHDFM